MRPRRIEPKPGQESVWDYPRPSRIEPMTRHVRIIFHDQIIADSNWAVRVLETSHPPGIYIPPNDVRSEFLRRSTHLSFCEWKGRAAYHHLVIGDRQSTDAAWSHPDPVPSFSSIRDHLTFYPSRVDARFVGDDLVIPQDGGFYGGWITPELVGPFKGGEGSWGW